MLANRLKRVVGQVISLPQNAFVEGRQILDATLIANEVIDALKRRKESGFLCKLDQGFQRRKRKARRFCVCEARRKPRGVEA